MILKNRCSFYVSMLPEKYYTVKCAIYNYKKGVTKKKTDLSMTIKCIKNLV